jgi:hypothetical protein
MANKAKKTAKRKTKAEPSVSRTIRNSASDVIDEVESAGEVVLGEIRNSFDFISGKVTDTAKLAADTTRAVTRKITSKDSTRQIHALLSEVEQAGESLLKIIGDHFDSLKGTVLSASGSAKPAAKMKKKVTRKKAAAKKAVTKKPVTRKKTSSKKTPVAKHVVTRKKASAKKAPAPRKAAAQKKTATKKTTAKKTATKKRMAKKSTAKKSTAKKTMARKKAVTRKKAG